MDVILKDFVKHLGDKNELVSVKPGYARNYLIPQGLAVMATPSAKKQLEENQRQAAHKREKELAAYQEIAEKINDTKVQVSALVGQEDKIFGSVTALQLANQLKEKGIEVDRRKITLPEDVKTLGEYTAKVDLAKNISAELTFEVIAKEKN